MSSFQSDLRCPDDAHLLRTETQGPAPFAVCRHCAGLWFSRDAIERPLVTGATTPEASRRWSGVRLHTVRACPICRLKLSIERIDGIEIDRCRQCGGVWLDAGEYEAARLRLQRQHEVPENRSRRSGGSAVGDAFSVAEVVVLLIAGD